MAGLFCGTVAVLVAGPIALNAISWKFYIVLIIPPTIEFICIYLFFPETKVSHLWFGRWGKTLMFHSNGLWKILRRSLVIKWLCIIISLQRKSKLSMRRRS